MKPSGQAPWVSARSRQTAPVPSHSAGVWLLAAGETLVWVGLFYVFAALLLSPERDLGLPKTGLTIGFTLAVLTAALLSPVAGAVLWGIGGYTTVLWAVFGMALAGLGLVAVLVWLQEDAP